MEEFSLLRFALGAAFLGYACVRDWKTREVSDKVWLILGSIAFIVLAVQLDGVEATWQEMLLLIPSALIFFDIFWDRDEIYDGETGKVHFGAIALYAAATASFIAGFYLAGFTGNTIPLMMLTAMIVLGILFFFMGVLHGGADAKAFITIAILAPVYPTFLSFPLFETPFLLGLGFPFALAVLLNSALMLLAVPPALMIFNATRGDLTMPRAAFGYRMPLEKAENAFVWPMERVVDGEVVIKLFPPKDDESVEDAYAALKEAGRDDIWVTPQIPFLIPLTIGFVVTFVVGNLLYALLGIAI